MTRRRWTALAAAVLVALPFLLAGDSAKAETPPADHLTSETIDLGNGYGQTLWRDAEGNAYDLGLIFRLPGPVPGIPIPVVYVGGGDVPGMIRSAAARYGVDAGRMERIARCESQLQPGATSRGGHRGIFQFDGPTWRGRAGWAGVSPDFSLAYDPRANVEVAAATMARGEVVAVGVPLMELDAVNCADALDFARSLPSESVDLCLTSPPYWKLRENGEGQWGQEATPEEYVAHLVSLFAEVRRALKPRGVLLLNLGDTYMNHPGGGSRTMTTGNRDAVASVGRQVRRHPTIRTKELVGIPWMTAFALRVDGWRIRAENIWAKPNGVPETAKDRCTRNHEHVFHLTKRPDAYWDWEAISEPAAWARWGKQTVKKGRDGGSGSWIKERSREEIAERFKGRKNRRSVWTFRVKPYPGDHKAVMPLEVAELGVLAGCPPFGLVYDPFMGAGTTAVAAVRLGRHYVGSELRPESVAEAEARIAAELACYKQPVQLDAAG